MRGLFANLDVYLFMPLISPLIIIISGLIFKLQLPKTLWISLLIVLPLTLIILTIILELLLILLVQRNKKFICITNKEVLEVNIDQIKKKNSKIKSQINLKNIDFIRTSSFGNALRLYTYANDNLPCFTGTEKDWDSWRSYIDEKEGIEEVIFILGTKRRLRKTIKRLVNILNASEHSYFKNFYISHFNRN